MRWKTKTLLGNVLNITIGCSGESPSGNGSPIDFGDSSCDYTANYKDPRIKWKSIPPKVCPHCGQEME
jgi:hypothetical protein